MQKPLSEKSIIIMIIIIIIIITSIQINKASDMKEHAKPIQFKSIAYLILSLAEIRDSALELF